MIYTLDQLDAGKIVQGVIAGLQDSVICMYQMVVLWNRVSFLGLSLSPFLS